MSKQPKTQGDWAAIEAQNKALTERLKVDSASYIDMPDNVFAYTLKDLTEEQLKAMLTKMKSTRAFYRKIIQEPYYIENPEKKNTHRHEDAEKKYHSVNNKGMLIISLIKKL